MAPRWQGVCCEAGICRWDRVFVRYCRRKLAEVSASDEWDRGCWVLVVEGSFLIVVNCNRSLGKAFLIENRAPWRRFSVLRCSSLGFRMVVDSFSPDEFVVVFGLGSTT